MQGHSKCLVVFIAQVIVVFFANFFAHVLVKRPTDFVDDIVALWVRVADFSTKFVSNPVIHHCLHLVIWQDELVLLCLWLNLLCQLTLQCDSWLHHLVRPRHRLDDDFFVDFICTSFHHGNATFDTSDYKVKIALGALFRCQKCLELATHTANT